MPLAAILALPLVLAAHPGVGVVVDAKGNVFYTDLKQVLRLAPDGSKSVVVPNVHTHELFLELDGTLLGEHLWYEGDATGKWGHRVWKRSPDGVVSDVIPATEGFRGEYSFVRDARGHMHWADGPVGAGDKANRVRVLRRSPDGAVSVLAGGVPGHADGRGEAARFHAIRWMTASPDGTVHLIDAGALRRVAPDGTVTTLATLFRRTVRSLFEDEDRHRLMGLAADGEGNVYVANNAECRVDRVGADGAVSVFSRSTAPWSPTGVTVSPSGDAVWILEYSLLGVRVRKVPAPALKDAASSPSTAGPNRRR